MQGYLTLAVDRQKYYDMSIQLALSLKLWDPDKPIALIYNEGITLGPEADIIFDETIFMPSDENYVGVMNKIRVYDYTPFNKTIFVDADCIMMKKGIDYYWKIFDGHGFNLLGNKSISGAWKGFEIKEVISSLGIDYMVRMNAGVFYFEVGGKSKEFFDYTNSLCTSALQILGSIHQEREGQYSIEPLLGAAMGRFGIEPLSLDPAMGSLMVSTWRARNCRFDVRAGISELEKPSGFWFNLPHAALGKGWVKHSPIFAHFIDRKPRKQYQKARDQLWEFGEHLIDYDRGVGPAMAAA